MNDDTTIIITTTNCEKHILHNIKLLLEYMRKHNSIKQLILTDTGSTDYTLPAIIHFIHTEKNPTISLITHPKKVSKKQALVLALEQVTTTNTIILEQELNTRLGQLRAQIKKLRKCDVVIPDPNHKQSTYVLWQNKSCKNKRECDNLIKKSKIDKIPHPALQNIAFKTEKIIKYLKKTKTEELFLAEAILRAQKKGLRITITSTKYREETPLLTQPHVQTLRKEIRLLKKETQ